jgi:hypothetical protein
MTLTMGKTSFDSPFNWFESKYAKTWKDLTESEIKTLMQKEFKIGIESTFIRTLFTKLESVHGEPFKQRITPIRVLGKRIDLLHRVEILTRKAVTKAYYVQYRDTSTGRFISKKDFVKRHR